MPWMTRWPGAFPVFVDRRSGARFIDVDGHEYVDLCLGDTGAMTGQPAAGDRGGRAPGQHGHHHDAPVADAIWVGRGAGRRFGLPRWQLAMSATDANRFVLRFARRLTGRPRIAVMDWCYHGTVDETLAVLDGDRVVPRPGAMGPQVDVALTTAVVPFNDLEALERRLAAGDLACLLMEPALTNIGIVLPDPGYPDAVREITRRYGVLLVIDDTHTLCAGPGGCHAPPGGWTRTWWSSARRSRGGIPAAAYGMSAAGGRAAVGSRCSAHGSTWPAWVGPYGQRAGPGRGARDAVDLSARGGLRRAVPLALRFTEGSPVSATVTAPVARAAPRLPRGVLVLPPTSRRGGRGRRSRTRSWRRSCTCGPSTAASC